MELFSQLKKNIVGKRKYTFKLYLSTLSDLLLYNDQK